MFGVRQRTRATALKDATARLNFGWLLAVGPADDRLGLLAVRDGIQTTAVAKESRRLRAKLAVDGDPLSAAPSTVRLALCCASPKVAAELRRAVLDRLAPGRLGGDVLRVPVALVERTVREIARERGVRLFDAAERNRRVEGELMRL